MPPEIAESSNDEAMQVLPTAGFEGFVDDPDDNFMEDTGMVAETTEQPVPEEEAIAVDPTEEVKEPEQATQEVATNEQPAVDEPTQEANAQADSTDNNDQVQAQEQTQNANQEDELSKKEKYERHQRSVQRRINKEVKKREALKAQNDALQARLDALEASMQTKESQNEAAILENRIRNASAIKQQLMEDGEYAKVAEVDNDILEMKLQQRQIQEQAQYEKQQYAQQQQQYAQQPQPQQPPPPQIPAIQQEWIRNNQRFGTDPGYTDYVNNVYDQLMDEGWDPESPSMYRELNRLTNSNVHLSAFDTAQSQPQQFQQQTYATQPQNTQQFQQQYAQQSQQPQQQGYVQQQYPNQTIQQTSAQQPAPVQRPQAAPPPNVANAQATSNSRGLTEADKINMRNWGIDPNDTNARKEWLANKRRA